MLYFIKQFINILFSYDYKKRGVMYKSIYLNLKDIRLEKKLSVYRVAKDLKVQNQTITDHEQNKIKYVNLKFLMNLCNYYGVTLDKIIKLDEEV